MNNGQCPSLKAAPPVACVHPSINRPGNDDTGSLSRITPPGTIAPGGLHLCGHAKCPDTGCKGAKTDLRVTADRLLCGQVDVQCVCVCLLFALTALSKSASKGSTEQCRRGFQLHVEPSTMCLKGSVLICDLPMLVNLIRKICAREQF